MKKLIPVLLLLVLWSCNSDKKLSKKAYLNKIEEWKETRLERLKSERGWLNLAGLYWIVEGENSFGSDSSNDIVFPPEAPKFAGELIRQGDSVYYYSEKNKGVSIDGETKAFSQLQPDVSGSPTIMESGNLRWFIIKRDSLIGIRLRKLNHPRIEELDHIPSFKIDPDWRKVARFISFPEPDTMWIPTAIGIDEMYLVPGKLVFRHKRKNYELLPFKSGKDFFLIIGDKTSAKETYAAGRFMYTEGPDEDNRVILDFNKAYNPPCAFSPYATCPLPPPENRLNLRITAGEKAVHLE